MLCGGTLVYDEFGTLLSWFRKPGTQLSMGKDYENENIIGSERRSEFLSNIAHRVKNGQIGLDHGSDRVQPHNAIDHENHQRNSKPGNVAPHEPGGR
jgi:hypothetical protein